MRNVIIRFDESFKTAPHDEAIDKAIGYLSMWAIHSDRHTDVSLWIDKGLCVSASYGKIVNTGSSLYPNKAIPNPTYTMYAMRDEVPGKPATYSFHS